VTARLIRFSALAAAYGLLGSAALAGQPSGKKQFFVQADFEKIAEESGEGVDPESLVRESIRIIEGRLDADRDERIVVTYQGNGRLSIETPRTITRETMEDILGIPAELGFRIAGRLGSSCRIDERTAQGATPPDVESDSPEKDASGIGRDNLVSALPSLDRVTGAPTVIFEFDESGAQKLAELTSENLGRCLEIVLDGDIVSAATIHEPILGGRMQLSGGLTEESAQDLAVTLRSGALPAPFEIVDVRLID